MKNCFKWNRYSTLQLVYLREMNNTKDLDVILDDIIKHLLPARTFEACYPAVSFLNHINAFYCLL